MARYVSVTVGRLVVVLRTIGSDELSFRLELTNEVDYSTYRSVELYYS